jgi:hypothetical protein
VSRVRVRAADACGLFLIGGIGLLGIELAGRSIARASLFTSAVGTDAPTWPLVVTAGVLALLALAALRSGGRLTANAVTSVVLLAAFVAGMAVQLRVGARLQSDGFYYFAHLRSLWFDHDQDLTNDYRLLGLGDKAHLFTPTPTGYAQSAWTIGPSLVWGPFFAVGDRVARGLNARGRQVAIDGTSFPYRQAVCVAGLVWGLVGLFFCFRVARTIAPAGLAGLATVAVAGGSFILWYLVKEPTMTHAPSMAAVATFTWAWVVTRGHRTRRQWMLLGLAAGLMGTIRWQNVIFAILPAGEWVAAALPLARRGDAQRLRARVVDGVGFTAAAVVGFLPQLLVWKAIYGRFFAVSPIGPEIRLFHPRLVDILWSSQNGLFATSPVLYVGAIGLFLLWRRDRLLAVCSILAVAAMTWFNASIQDWWGSAAFGMRRFDGALPLFVLGTAIAADDAARFVGRHPRLVVGATAALLIVWNLTFMNAALTGRVRIGEPLAFAPLAGEQVATIERFVGHPFSWPANLIFAARNGVSPSEYDLLFVGRFLADPMRPFGRVDVGGDDGPWLEEGWNGPERARDVTYRWAGETSAIRIVLDYAAPLVVQVRAQAFTWPAAPPQRLTLEINGTAQAPLTIPPQWAIVEQTVPAAGWRAGVNQVVLRFERATRPRDVGVSADHRLLSAAVDYVRVVEVR